jgi:hypothetical protein
VRGFNRDPKNCLRWDHVRLNLPGNPKYDSMLPQVMRWGALMKKIVAGDIVGSINDLRASGYSTEQAWAVARQVASRFQYLGIQDAPRKRRPPSQSPGAWAGAVFLTKDGKVTKSVTQEKWDKAKGMVEELTKEADGRPNHEYCYKRLEQIRGFMCHMAMTYETITPFLKGLPLTLASFLSHRDAEGWKLSDRQWLDHIRKLVKEGKMSEADARRAKEAERAAQRPEAEWYSYMRSQLDGEEISEEEAQAALDARI